MYVSQPLDTVKVKMQTFPTIYKGMSNCLIQTFKKDGIIRGLYAGTLPSIAANVAENSILFAGNAISCYVIVTWHQFNAFGLFLFKRLWRMPEFYCKYWGPRERWWTFFVEVNSITFNSIIDTMCRAYYIQSHPIRSWNVNTWLWHCFQILAMRWLVW